MVDLPSTRMAQDVGIGLVGTGFMGRAHANAWGGVNRFFSLRRSSRMKTVAGVDPDDAAAFAEKWGFETSTGDWHSMLQDDSINLIDITTPKVERLGLHWCPHVEVR